MKKSRIKKLLADRYERKSEMLRDKVRIKRQQGADMHAIQILS
jgi:hypothetical protein